MHRPEPSPGPAHHSPSPEPQNPPPQPPIRRTTRSNAGKQPGEWWKLKSPSPAPESDDEDDDEFALVASSSQAVPQSFRDAMASPDAQKWLEALLLEINNLIANGTWEICDLPSGMRAIGCK